MKFYQWLVLLLAITFMINVIRQYRSRKRLIGSTIIWVVFWVVISALAIMPDFISINIAELLGFHSNINAVIFVALGFLYVFMFYTTAVVERLERQVTEIVRKLAIENQHLRDKLSAHELENEDSLHR
ncbi:MAG: DUF2304 domain-containing protein [Saprospiraceae bacterium]|nr:DUF2304 domain-containing protein [Saprospiraceae bacterium]